MGRDQRRWARFEAGWVRVPYGDGMHRPSASLLVVALLGACSADKGFGETQEVTATDYGSAWPLTVDSALLNCDENGSISVQVQGAAFRIDDITDPQDVPSGFLRIWATDPAQASGRKELKPLLEHGRSLCG